MTPTGAAAAVLCTAGPELLELALEDDTVALAPAVLPLGLNPKTELSIVLCVANSVGIVVLNAPVTVGAGASAVVSSVEEAAAALDDTTLVSACWLLLSSDSVDTSTLKGWVWAHVDCELCAVLRPMRDQIAEDLRAERRILGKRGGVDDKAPVGYLLFLRFDWEVVVVVVVVVRKEILGCKIGFVVVGCRIWMVGRRQLVMARWTSAFYSEIYLAAKRSAGTSSSALRFRAGT